MNGVSTNRTLGKQASLKSSSGGSLTAAPPTLAKHQNEELQKMNQDLNVLSQKLVDLQNMAFSKQGSSAFVNNIRDSTSSSPAIGGGANLNFFELKCQIMEKLISKMSEVDRCILRSTEPSNDDSEVSGEPAQKSVRRSSRGLDLSIFPTHLHVIDRLVDIHVSFLCILCHPKIVLFINL